ncbi:hypothetical protein HHI36_008246 [Cryptolaemus montrouzieri]|uniref:Uncharacterized protein n=1 Tax=Cryptolaemus montrouzieri TaxID=559131 RepID=A0ABD2MRW8_9CUCU
MAAIKSNMTDGKLEKNPKGFFCDKCIPVALEKLSGSLVASPFQNRRISKQDQKEILRVLLSDIEELVEKAINNQYQKTIDDNTILKNEMLNQCQALKSDIKNLKESNVDLVRMLSTHQQGNITTKVTEKPARINQKPDPSYPDILFIKVTTQSVQKEFSMASASKKVAKVQESNQRKSDIDSLNANEEFVPVGDRERKGTEYKIRHTQEIENRAYGNSSKHKPNNKSIVIGKALSGTEGLEGANKMACLMSQKYRNTKKTPAETRHIKLVSISTFFKTS